jgi:hypothetical protein
VAQNALTGLGQAAAASGLKLNSADVSGSGSRAGGSGGSGSGAGRSGTGGSGAGGGPGGLPAVPNTVGQAIAGVLKDS